MQLLDRLLNAYQQLRIKSKYNSNIWREDRRNKQQTEQKQVSQELHLNDCGWCIMILRLALRRKKQKRERYMNKNLDLNYQIIYTKTMS